MCFFSLTERLPSRATLLLIQNITYCFLATNKQPYQSEIGRFLDEAFRPLQSPLNPQKKASPTMFLGRLGCRGRLMPVKR